MKSDTYEKQTTERSLETYEWDRVWIDHPYDTEAKRVLYVGDSISYGTRSVVAKLAENTFLWDGFATSKAVDNPFFPDMLHLFRKQAPKCDVLLFNNGLHGWHLDDEKGYPQAYETMLKFLLEEWCGTTVVPVLTTCLADGERNDRVRQRNEAVRRIAEQYRLPVLDLYSVSERHRTLMLDDGVHFTPEGYEALAKEILFFIQSLSSLHT